MLLNCGVGEDSWESLGDREAWHAAVYWVTKSWTQLRSWTKLNWWAITRALHGCLRGRPSSPPWKTVSSLQFLRVWQSRILRPSALHTCIPSPRTFFNPYSLYLRPWALVVIVQCAVLANSLRPHGLQHTRLPCPSPSPRACSNSCPLSQWCHPTISSSAVPYSSCPQSFPASGYFPMSQLFTSGGQSIGASASASVLPMNIQDWFPLGLTGWISLQSKGLLRIFSNTTVQKHQYFGVQLSL